MASPPVDYSPPTHFPDLTKARRIAIDIETSDPDLKTKGPGPRRDGYIVGVSLATDDGFCDYFPIAHSVGPNLDREKVLEYVGNQFAFFAGEVIGANLLYDWDFFQYQNILAPLAHFRDVQWDEALIDESSYSYSLNALAQKYLGETKVTDELKELHGKEYIAHFRDIHPGHARAYAMGDVTLPLRISDKQKPELKKQHLTKLSDIEHRLFPFLLYLRRNGVRVDLDKAQQLTGKFQNWVRRKLERAAYFAGQEVNVDNFGKPAFLAQVLEGMGVEVPKTDKGNYSITDAWLKKLKNPFGKQIAGANKYDKAGSTFIDGFVLDHQINGRVHPQFHPLRRVEDDGDSQGTITGRLSCTDPNLQQIPTRDPVIGPLCRSMFIADEGAEMYAIDYSQIEFRVLVHYALQMPSLGENTDPDKRERRERALAAAREAQRMYKEDPTTDFHNMVVALTGLPRKHAKNINFGLAFAMGRNKLARQLGLVDEKGQPTAKCLEIFATYHEKVGFVKELGHVTSREAEDKGFITTMLGRRGRFNTYEPREIDYESSTRPEALPYEEALKVYGKEIRRAMLHKAVNKRIQGTAADLNKVALVNIWESGILFGNDITASLTVHDELLGSAVPSEKGKKALAEVRRMMETALEFDVPILTGMGTGQSWAEAK